MARYRKTYKTRSNEARIPIQLGDVTLDAHFTNGNIRDNEWATLTTSSSLAQFIIENSPYYGKRILLQSSVEIKEPKKEPELNPENVKTMSEARVYMSKVYGVDMRSISAPNALKSCIAKHGVEFPNLQW